MNNMNNQSGTIDIGPKNWKQAMPILEVLILDGERQGRKDVVEQVRKMAEVADLLPEAIAIIKEARKLTPNVGTFLNEAMDGTNPDGFAYTDPLTLRIEAFIKSIPVK